MSALEMLAVEIYEANLPKEYEDEIEEIIKEMEGVHQISKMFIVLLS